MAAVSEVEVAPAADLRSLIASEGRLQSTAGVRFHLEDFLPLQAKQEGQSRSVANPVLTLAHFAVEEGSELLAGD